MSPALDINLSELQKTLDAQGIEIVDNQKESVIGRKALADKTKGVSTLSLLNMRKLTYNCRIQENIGCGETKCIQGPTQGYGYNLAI